jgi:tetratricopeptide (TPR) repeat protein
MSTPRGLKQRLATVSRLWAAAAYDKALAEVESLLEVWPGNAHLHLLRASLIQVQEEPKYHLDEAKRALQQAIELDKGSPAASIELGHFLDNVDDDPQAAVKAYTDGVATARHLLIDGLIGQAKAYWQLDKREEFLRCLLEVLQQSHFDAGSKRYKAGARGADVVVHSPSGQVYVIQLKGPYAEQVQELLNDLVADRSA